jgi:hypothetical protein
MKKIVLTFGLISGAILSAMMVITLPFHDEIGFDKGLIIGYTTMVVAFLLIYFGVRSYRDNVTGGTVGFGRAFAVGALIGGIASLCYVATWEVYYFKVAPDFMAKYQAAINAAMTFIEPLPAALIVALVSAGVLSRRRKTGMVEVAPARG